MLLRDSRLANFVARTANLISVCAEFGSMRYSLVSCLLLSHSGPKINQHNGKSKFFFEPSLFGDSANIHDSRESTSGANWDALAESECCGHWRDAGSFIGRDEYSIAEGNQSPRVCWHAFAGNDNARQIQRVGGGNHNRLFRRL